jgi:hypothetical protein
MNRPAARPSSSRIARTRTRLAIFCVASASVLAACGDTVSPTGDSIAVESTPSTDVAQDVDDTGDSTGPFGDTAVLTAFEGESDSEIWLVEGDGSNLRKITDNSDNDFDASWFPDRSSILFRRSSEAGPGATGLELWVMSPDGSNERRLVEGLEIGGEWTPYSWSPDGNRLVTTGFRPGIDPENNGVGGLYIVDVVTGEASLLVDTDNSDLWPSWSPDGSRIAFVKSGEPEFELYVVNVDGSNLTRLAEGSNIQSLLSWTNDGTTLIAAPFNGDEHQIVSIDVDTNTVTRLGPVLGSSPTISPDGTRIAYWTTGPDFPELWVMNIDGTSPRMVMSPFSEVEGGIQVSPGFGLAWSPDSTRVMSSFVNTLVNPQEDETNVGNFVTELWIIDVSGTQPTIRITDGRGPLSGSVSASWAS